MLRQKEGENKEYLLAIDVVNDLATKNPQLLLELELEYLIFSSEASTPTEQREWYATTAYSSPYKMSYAEYIKSDLGVRDLALVFHASYERSSDGDDELEERAIAAEKWYLIFTEDEMN